MVSFSERFGYSTPSLPLSETCFPSSLRNGLWDICRVYCFSNISDEYNASQYSKSFASMTFSLWHDFLRLPVDERPTYPPDARAFIRNFFFKGQFNQIFDLIEFLCLTFHNGRDRLQFEMAINRVLEREMAAYRLVESILICITDQSEIDSISLSATSEVDGVRHHIRRSAELLSDRDAPDYRNSIKEAISAVEAAVGYVSGSKSGGVNKPLRKAIDDLVLHPSLREGFEKLYAYTSDAGGIRHAILKDGAEPSQADAKYMLVVCSAFANYLIDLHSSRQQS